MNIFYLDKDPKLAAIYQYNKHVVKMILESAQMLCTAHHCHSLEYETQWVPYKKAHVNHPSTRWARQSASNYLWLYKHMIALGAEYYVRYGKTHLTITKCEKPLAKYPDGILNTGFTEPPQCMPDQYKHKSAIHAYWQYYIAEKSNVAHQSENVYTSIPSFVQT